MDEDQNTPRGGRHPARGDADFPAEYHTHADEISLYDLWDVLVRRLPVLIGVAALVTLGGLGYALMQPVQYEYRSGVDLPRVYHQEEGLEVVVSRASVLASLQDVIIPRQRDELFGNEEGGPRVETLERGGEHSLVLQSASTPDNADRISRLHEAIIETLAGQLESRYETRLAASVRPHENRALMLEEQIGLLQDQLNDLSERLDGADGVSSLVVAQQMGDIRRETAELRSERVDARSAMESIRSTSHGVEQTFLASESEFPAGTSRTLILALSIVLGGMLGLFAAFFWEFVTNARKYRQSQASSE